MTRKITLLLMSLVVLGFKLGTKAYADTDGFRGLKWGTEFTAVKDEMNYVRTDLRSRYGAVKIYSRKNEELRIGGAEVQSIRYSFWKDKLSSVMIRFKDYSNFVSIKDSVFKRLGEGHKTKRYIKGYVWGGEVTAMALYYDEAPKEGYLFMYSIDLQKEQQRFVEKKGIKPDF